MGIIISRIIQLMNNMMEYLSLYRFALLDDLSLELMAVVLFYGMIWFSYLFYQTTNKKYLFGALICMLIVGIIEAIHTLLSVQF
jgi:hypothetical protein